MAKDRRTCVGGWKVTDVFGCVDDVLGQFAAKWEARPGALDLARGRCVRHGGSGGCGRADENVPQRLAHHWSGEITADERSLWRSGKAETNNQKEMGIGDELDFAMGEMSDEGESRSQRNNGVWDWGVSNAATSSTLRCVA